MKKTALIVISLFLVLSLSGCKLLQVCTQGLASAGIISQTQADSMVKVGEAGAKAFKGFNPKQEYYVGRTVAANILHRYKPYNNPQANTYVNTLGQALAYASDKPDTFNGYRFLILDTDEINAFATPGGFIFVTRGLLRCCKNEDSVASVLAHELGHVQLEHGIGAIKGARKTELIKVLAIEGTKNYGTAEAARLATAFDNTIGDIVKTMVDKGYQKGQEYDADAAAVTILNRVGYSPTALADMLKQMDKRWNNKGAGFMRTHPSPKDRLAKLDKLLKNAGPVRGTAARKARFQRAMAGI